MKEMQQLKNIQIQWSFIHSSHPLILACSVEYVNAHIYLIRTCTSFVYKELIRGGLKSFWNLQGFFFPRDYNVANLLYTFQLIFMWKTDKCHFGRIREMILLFQHPVELSYDTNSVNQSTVSNFESLSLFWLVSTTAFYRKRLAKSDFKDDQLLR